MSDRIQAWPYSSLKVEEPAPKGMWEGFYVEGRPFGRLSMYKNDFHTWTPGEWTITEVDAGAGDTSQILLDGRNGILKLMAAGNEDDGVQITLGGSTDSTTTGECWAPAAGKNLWFETSLYADDVDQCDFFVGLHVEDTTIIAGRGTDYIGFSSDDADALLDFATCASSVASNDLGIATLTDSGVVKLGFKVSSTSKIEYYVNDILKGTLQSNIPTGLMRLSLAFLTGEATANSLFVDYVVVAQER